VCIIRYDIILDIYLFFSLRSFRFKITEQNSRLEMTLILTLMVQSGEKRSNTDRTNRGIQKNFSEVGESFITLDHQKHSWNLPGFQEHPRFLVEIVKYLGLFRKLRVCSTILTSSSASSKKFELSTRSNVFLPTASDFKAILPQFKIQE